MSAEAPRTLIRLALRNAAEAPSTIAMREKDRGIWKELTWAAYADQVLALAAGLDALGVAPGDAMMVLGDNRARLYMGMVAASALCVYPMPTYPGATLEELQHFAGEVRISVALAEDQEQVDKVLELRAAGAQIAHVIYDDPRGLAGYEAPGLVSWDDVVARGAERLMREPGLRDALVARSGPDDPAVFLHSSGTTGKPKGIVLSQRNAIAAAENGKAAGMFGTGEELLAYLPMAWVGDYELAVGAAVTHRFTVNVPERAETVLRDLREIAPTLYLAAPRSWDSILTTIQVGIENSSRLKRAVYHAFMDRAVAAERARLQGKATTGLSGPMRVLGDVLVFGPIKDQFGLSRLTHAFTGARRWARIHSCFSAHLGSNCASCTARPKTAR